VPPDCEPPLREPDERELPERELPERELPERELAEREPDFEPDDRPPADLRPPDDLRADVDRLEPFLLDDFRPPEFLVLAILNSPGSGVDSQTIPRWIAGRVALVTGTRAHLHSLAEAGDVAVMDLGEWTCQGVSRHTSIYRGAGRILCSPRIGA
jgi:hypothetical protein